MLYNTTLCICIQQTQYSYTQYYTGATALNHTLPLHLSTKQYHYIALLLHAYLSPCVTHLYATELFVSIPLHFLSKLFYTIPTHTWLHLSKQFYSFALLNAIINFMAHHYKTMLFLSYTAPSLRNHSIISLDRTAPFLNFTTHNNAPAQRYASSLRHNTTELLCKTTPQHHCSPPYFTITSLLSAIPLHKIKLLLISLLYLFQSMHYHSKLSRYYSSHFPSIT